MSNFPKYFKCLLTLLLIVFVIYFLINNVLEFGQPEVININGVNVYAPSSTGWFFFTARLRYGGGYIPMYTYSSLDRVSRSLRRFNTWEGGLLSEMEEFLNSHTDVNVIDIGCNLGIYSLIAAKIGRQAVAVDPNIDNLKRLHRSLMDNHLEHRVQLVANAISSVRSKFELLLPEWDNVGHAMIAKARDGAVTSIYMDDLLPVIGFKKALIKIDIEGHESAAFHHARKLFSQVEIVAVMMEWQWVQKDKDSRVPLFLLRFFTDLGYEAYPHLSSNIRCSGPYTSWTSDIVWKKRNF